MIYFHAIDIGNSEYRKSIQVGKPKYFHNKKICTVNNIEINSGLYLDKRMIESVSFECLQDIIKSKPNVRNLKPMSEDEHIKFFRTSMEMYRTKDLVNSFEYEGEIYYTTDIDYAIEIVAEINGINLKRETLHPLDEFCKNQAYLKRNEPSSYYKYYKPYSVNARKNMHKTLWKNYSILSKLKEGHKK